MCRRYAVVIAHDEAILLRVFVASVDVGSVRYSAKVERIRGGRRNLRNSEYHIVDSARCLWKLLSN